MALCSESTGRMTAPVRAQMSRTRPPARTRDSLLARQTTLPARAAARVPASRPRPPGPKARWRLRAGPPVAHSPRALPERAACIRREAGRRVFRRRPRPARPGRAGGGVGPGPPGAPHYGRRPDPTRGRSPVWPPPRPGRCADGAGGAQNHQAARLFPLPALGGRPRNIVDRRTALARPEFCHQSVRINTVVSVALPRPEKNKKMEAPGKR